MVQFAIYQSEVSLIIVTVAVMMGICLLQAFATKPVTDKTISTVTSTSLAASANHNQVSALGHETKMMRGGQIG